MLCFLSSALYTMTLSKELDTFTCEDDYSWLFDESFHPFHRESEWEPHISMPYT